MHELHHQSKRAGLGAMAPGDLLDRPPASRTQFSPCRPPFI